MVITHDGRVVHEGVADLLRPAPRDGPGPGETPAGLLPEGGADVDGPSN